MAARCARGATLVVAGPFPFSVLPVSKAFNASRLDEYLGDESGASAAEYALILALVAIAIIGGLTDLGTTINGVPSTDAAKM